MMERDQAHVAIDQVRELDAGEHYTTDEISILGVEYTLRFTQPEAGRLVSFIGGKHKQRVELEAPSGDSYQFWFDPTGPTHDAANALREKLFSYHSRYYGRIN